ncbi:MAG: hypothetical protein IT324_06810 [Anaerolineae bacterium]|nr:hypothetical protein [Anaerolineae bacterium]
MGKRASSTSSHSFHQFTTACFGTTVSGLQIAQMRDVFSHNRLKWDYPLNRSILSGKGLSAATTFRNRANSRLIAGVLHAAPFESTISYA